MKKCILTTIACIVFCCTFLLSGFDVRAADPYYVAYSEPNYSENSGYLVLEYASGKVATLFWSAYAQSEYLNDVESVNTSCSLVIDEQKVILTILTDSNIDADVQNVTTQYTFSNYSSSGTHNVIKSGSVVDSNPTYTFTTTGTIKGFYYKGNVSLVTNQLDGNNSKPVVVFGDNIVGQYIHDLYQKCASSNELLTLMKPMIEELGDLLTLIEADTESIKTDVDSIEQEFQLLLLKMTKIQLEQEEQGLTLDSIELYLEEVRDLIIEYFPQYEFQLEEIRYTLYDIEEALFSQGSIDKDVMNDFRDDSSDQSTTINGLNNQSFVPKPNVNDMSDAVDSNLDVDIDANYGMLLSTFTTNRHVLTMLLLVASISLISYVLFGKR